MNRRQFTGRLAALAATPTLPAPVLGAKAATTSAFVAPSGMYMWSEMMARAQNRCSPSIIENCLGLDSQTAKSIHSQLMSNGVIGAPDINGVSRAVRPLYSKIAHSAGHMVQQSKSVAKNSPRINRAAQISRDDQDQEISDSARPQNTAQKIDWIRLVRSRRVGPVTFQRLMREHQNAKTALEALPEIARQAGAQRYAPCSYQAAETKLQAGIRLKADLLFYGAPNYPKLLYDLPDAPPMLWAMGRPDLVACPSVALVGARNASVAGKAMATRLANGLGAAGHVVVSGLARGIDLAAHKAALTTGTIAVLAGGVDVNYPKESAELAAEIRDKGLVLSEMPPGLQPQSRHFPPRNRIISGLCSAVVVVEGALRSGSLITARNALDYGRDVMAVPGSPLDARSGGCNALIRDGATLVRNAADILDVVTALTDMRAPQTKPLAFEKPAPSPETNSGFRTIREKAVLARLGATPICENDLIADLGADPGAVLAVLGELELRGEILRHPGGAISAAAPTQRRATG